MGKGIIMSKACNIKNCNRKYYAKGYCNKHYKHLSWNSNAYMRRLGRGKIYFAGVCRVEDCARGIYANRYCRMHYERIRRAGSLGLINVREFKSFPTKANSMRMLLIKDLITVALIRVTLTNRERKIIAMRFWNGLTLARIAAVFHLTRERIRQIETEAIKKIRKFAKKEV